VTDGPRASDDGDVVRMRTPAGEEEIEILRVEYV
jgi:transcription elongation GreA/GreB family factor